MRGDIARAGRISEDKVHGIVPDTGSGYGGKHRVEAATEAALAAYSSGQGTLVSVIESARTWWDVQAEQVMAEAALGEAWARLNRATGRTKEGRP